MKMLQLPSGRQVPQFGQGTWEMAHQASNRQQEIEALRLGLDLGMTLIDTAEMYGEGEAEKLVGEAIEGRRDEVFVVSKVYPHNGTKRGVIEACNRSLRRLKTDRIDLYLLHWRGSVPLKETLDGFSMLKREGKILEYGVSNFDLGDMEEAMALEGGNEIASNQVLYNLVHRGIEYDLMPWSRERSIPLMAYSPIDKPNDKKKGMLNNEALRTIAATHHATPAVIAIAWLLQQEVIVIPKSGNPAHVRENHAAASIVLTAGDINMLDEAFPPPKRKTSLAMR